ncbi:MAG: DUF3421 domain-containing protein [Coxiellaceae bacterium]|nr:DUF3421 domain-containing protein [Coxiellaceae bacterium]
MKKLILLFLLFSTFFAAIAQAATWGVGYKSAEHAFKIGHEADGRALYLCRANYKGSQQPGKTWHGYDKCNIPFGGREIETTDYSVYLQSYKEGHWIRGGRSIPEGAMQVGRDVSGAPLFLCRAYYRGGIQPGKTWSGYNNCNIPYAGKEVLVSHFDIYQLNGAPRNNGRHRHHRHHRVKRACLSDNFGNQACGYGCVKSIKGVKCASRRGQVCMADDFGNISCGFNCVKTIKGVFCASHRDDNCVSNAFGDVRCGRNCSVNSFGQFQCN